MSVSGIESCVRELGVDDASKRYAGDDFECASILRAADEMCRGLEPLVAMKSGWTIIESDEYASGAAACGGARLGDALVLAGAVAMMEGLVGFIDDDE